jgi:hypothetical protein
MVKTGTVGNGQNTFGGKPWLGFSLLTSLVPVRFLVSKDSIASFAKSGCTHLFFVFQAISKGKHRKTPSLVFDGRQPLKGILVMPGSNTECFRVNENTETLYDKAELIMRGYSRDGESKHYTWKLVFMGFSLGDRDRECRYLLGLDAKNQANLFPSKLFLSCLQVTFLGQGYLNLKGNWNIVNPFVVHSVKFNGFEDYDVALTCAKG